MRVTERIRRVLALLLLCPAALALCPGQSVQAAHTEQTSPVSQDSRIDIDTSGDKTYGVFTYRETQEGIVLTSCDTAQTSVEIPEKIDGKAVTAIGDAAFRDCVLLTDILIPGCIKAVGESAFSECSMLCSVTAEKGVQQLGKGAFESCTMLSEINLPDTITELPEACFYNCSYIPALTLPDSIEIIGDECFYSCTKMQSITLPAKLKEIGRYAFQNCQWLSGVDIPAGCRAIGDYAFDGCQSLAAINVNEKNPDYSSQDGVLFSADGSTLLRFPPAMPKSVYEVPADCTALADWSFIGAAALEEIDLNHVTSIGEDCFYYCGSLKKIEIPAGVTDLDSAVFAYCMGLEQAVIPEGVTALGDHLFYACSSLHDVRVPESVTRIGDRCFYSCTSLTALTLPDGIESVGEKALGWYTPAEAENADDAEIFKELRVSSGSPAVKAYLRHWRGRRYLWIYILTGGCILAAAAVVGGILKYRSDHRIRIAKR